MEKEAIPRREYIMRQIEEAKSEENKRLAKEKLGHSPSNQEAILHYAESGGAKAFADKYRIEGVEEEKSGDTNADSADSKPSEDPKVENRT